MTREIVRRPWERIDRILGAGVRIPRGGLSADKLAELDWFYAGIKPHPTDPPGYGVGPYPGRRAVAALPRYEDGGEVTRYNPDEELISPTWPTPVQPQTGEDTTITGGNQPAATAPTRAAGQINTNTPEVLPVAQRPYPDNTRTDVWDDKDTMNHLSPNPPAEPGLLSFTGAADHLRIIGAATEKLYSEVIINLARPADAVSDGNGITDQNERNAIGHAHTSASIAFEWGDPFALVFGEAKELAPTLKKWSHFETRTDDEIEDMAKDRFNNAVGRRIAAYAEANNITTPAELDDLVVDALLEGKLITKLDGKGVTEPTLWNGPSENWRGRSKGRLYR